MVEDNGGSALRGRWGRGQRRRCAPREAESRSMTAACFEGGGVEVDSSSATMTKNLRKRMVAACSEAGLEAMTCSRAGDEVVVHSRAGIEDGRWRRRRDGF
jgi:hypothetical protein